MHLAHRSAHVRHVLRPSLLRAQQATGAKHARRYVGAQARTQCYAADSPPPEQQPRPRVSPEHDMTAWSEPRLRRALQQHAMATWAAKPTSEIARDTQPLIVSSSGVYLHDARGQRYLDWTAQAICANLGHTVPPTVAAAVARQMGQVPYVYSELAACEPRGRMAQLLAESLPADLDGVLFPTSGAEANEVAIRAARRYTGRRKVLTHYRSYHGGTNCALNASGDPRGQHAAPEHGFLKMLHPSPTSFCWPSADADAGAHAHGPSSDMLALSTVEEQILHEDPRTIAAMLFEPISGSGGVLIPSTRYMRGLRALCDKYGIVFVVDEVMVGLGRTGKLWGFQHFDGVLPDIVTTAKGLAGAFMPIAAVVMRAPLRQFFDHTPLGWGGTYHAHPVTLACAYECLKHVIRDDLAGHAASLGRVMHAEMRRLEAKHAIVRQPRSIGLLGCFAVEGSDAHDPREQLSPSGMSARVPRARVLKACMLDRGLIGFLRPPLLYCAPPLVITETELMDGFERLDRALEQYAARVRPLDA